MTETAKPEIPLCIECVHCLWTGGDHACTRSASKKANPVTGEMELHGRRRCEWERDETRSKHGESCGPGGRHFERRPDGPAKPTMSPLRISRGTEGASPISAWDRFVDWVDGWRKS